MKVLEYGLGIDNENDTQYLLKFHGGISSDSDYYYKGWISYDVYKSYKFVRSEPIMTFVDIDWKWQRAIIDHLLYMDIVSDSTVWPGSHVIKPLLINEAGVSESYNSKDAFITMDQFYERLNK